jgi:fructokinase
MIICCGEALIDMLPRELDGADVFLPAAGGAIFNTAIGLGRLGEPVGFLCGISSDMFGEQLLDTLKASNVSTDYCVRLDQPTTLAFVKLENGHAKYSFFDENSALRMLSEANLPALPVSCNALHFGAISLIPEPCGSAYETLMAREHKTRVISFDPNIRPSFIKDEAAHRSRMNRMTAQSDIIKVSDEDIEWLAPNTPHEETIKGWLEGATSIVILTKGSEGATAFTKHGEASCGVPKVEVIDTVGAGDTFNSGFLSALNQADLLDKAALHNISNEALEAALELGAKVAAITVSRAGANPPFKSEL